MCMSLGGPLRCKKVIVAFNTRIHFGPWLPKNKGHLHMHGHVPHCVEVFIVKSLSVFVSARPSRQARLFPPSSISRSGLFSPGSHFGLYADRGWLKRIVCLKLQSSKKADFDPENLSWCIFHRRKTTFIIIERKFQKLSNGFFMLWWSEFDTSGVGLDLAFFLSRSSGGLWRKRSPMASASGQQWTFGLAKKDCGGLLRQK